ncbi:sensor histidine kinase [Oscillospiraceae bacterium 52-8]
MERERKRRGLSIKYKVFLLAFCLPASVAMLAVWALFGNAQHALEATLFEMQESASEQLAQSVASYCLATDRLLHGLADDSAIIASLELPADQMDQQTQREVRLKLLDRWSNQSSGAAAADPNSAVSYIGSTYSFAINAYVVGFNGLSANTLAADHYQLDSLRGESWFQEMVAADGAVCTSGTYKDESGGGVFRYYLFKGRLVKDHITGEPVGVVFFKISEAKYAEAMGSAHNQNRQAYILDGEDRVISSWYKPDIGQRLGELQGWTGESVKEEGYGVARTAAGDEVTVVRVPVEGTGFTFVELIPLSQLVGSVRSLRFYAFLLLGAIVLLIALADLLFTRWMTSPILALKGTMDRFSQGELDVRVQTDRGDELGQLALSFDHMAQRTQSLIRSIEDKERLKRKAELDFLQAQINPHFIYNTLSSVRFMVAMGKNDEAEEMLIRFVKMMRYITDKTDKLVPLTEEVEQIQNYAEILRYRYPDSFSIAYDIDPAAGARQIPSFILQPTIENAVYHNLQTGGPPCKIRVRARYRAGVLRITVTDNGQGIDKERLQRIKSFSIKMDDSVGIANIHSRLELVYGSGSYLKVRSQKGLGTSVLYHIEEGEGPA